MRSRVERPEQTRHRFQRHRLRPNLSVYGATEEGCFHHGTVITGGTQIVAQSLAFQSEDLTQKAKEDRPRSTANSSNRECMVSRMTVE